MSVATVYRISLGTLALLLLSVLTPSHLFAQWDTTPPTINIYGGTQHAGGLQDVTVQICEHETSIASYGIILYGSSASADVTSQFSPQLYYQSGCVSTYGTIQLYPGYNTLAVTAFDFGENMGTQTSNFYYFPPQVAVSPKHGLATAGELGQNTVTFPVGNPGQGTQTYTLTRTCSFANCSSPGSVVVNAGQTASVNVTFTAGAPGTSGQIRLRAAVGSVQDSGWIDVSVVAAKVVVRPKAKTVGVESGSRSQQFVVQNPGPASASYTLSRSCAGPAVSGCSTPPSSVTVPGGDSTVVTITYSASGSVGQQGGITLIATASHNAAITDTGSVTVKIGTQATPTVTVANVNPGDAVERELCLTIALGSNAAAECGDLRIVQPLPATRTMNRVRAPMLVYNSQTAHPYPAVAATVGLPANAANPDSVKAVLIIGAVRKDSATYAGQDWSPGRANRVVLAYDALADTNSRQAYTVEVSARYGGTLLTANATGTLLIVNRRGSAFGAGWWLAGLERLEFPAGGILWIGGDGSAKWYAPAGANRWAAPALDRPDTISLSGGIYTRKLPQKARVEFNSAGQHVKTVNTLGHETVFSYTTGRLTQITLPSNGTTRTYTLQYTGTSPIRLQSVTAPATHVSRVVTVTSNTNNQITGFTQPDNSAVSFGYDAGFTHRISSRTDERATVTSFAVDAAKRVREVSIAMGVGQTPIVTRIRSLESVGFKGAAAVDTADAYVRLDGPRSEVGDTSLFWLDRYGAPRRIVTALGRETRLRRDDARWPALVTWMRTPGNRVSSATYDSRGNLLTATDSSTFEGGQYATTTYEWHGVCDLPTRVVDPVGVEMRFDYESTKCNRLWQQPGTSSSRRILFSYHSHGLLATIERPLAGGAKDSVQYNTLGNVSRTRSARGQWNEYLQDGSGADTSTTVAVSSTTTRRIRNVYNRMGRDTLNWTIGGGDTIQVRTSYDPAGNTLRVERRSRKDIQINPGQEQPTTAAIGAISTEWTYDRAHRRTKEKASDGREDHWAYDPAGNQVAWTTRRGHSITAGFDAENRLTWRIVPSVVYADTTVQIGHLMHQFPIPAYANQGWALLIRADTVQFVYGADGQDSIATNRYSRIERLYQGNGLIASEQQTIRGAEFAPDSQKVYLLRYGYDRAGRRTKLIHPNAIAPRHHLSSTAHDSVAYSYDALGQLATVRDPMGYVTRFVYDLELRVDSIIRPGSVREQHRYDVDGNRRRRHQLADLEPAFSGNVVRNDTLSIDLLGRITWVGCAGGPVPLTQAQNTYKVLDGLTYNQLKSCQDVSFEEQEHFTVDALGHRHEYRPKAISLRRVYYYQPGTGRHLKTIMPSESVYWDTLSYDPAGNTNFVRSWTSDESLTYRGAKHYYDAADRLHTLDMRSCHVPGLTQECTTVNNTPQQYAGVFEEYRYDAYGRRIMVRARRDNSCGGPHNPNPCFSTLDRIIWDGDQLLYEIRRPAGDLSTAGDMLADTTTINLKHAPIGRVIYTHGPGIDRPLTVTRMGFTIGDTTIHPVGTFGEWFGATTVVPLEEWRGVYEIGIFAHSGKRSECKPNSSGTPTCMNIAWPAGDVTTHLAYKQPPEYRRWWGGLIKELRDGSGQLYRRNRYYDPISGRFTQEDPIGLAGGLNLYGFANGDPVNFSDPFGLCEDKDDPRCSIGQQAMANLRAGVNRAITAVGDFGNSLAAGLRSLVGEVAIHGGIALATGGGGNVLFSGSRVALRSALKTSWVEGVSGAQGLKLLERLGKGAVDDITIAAGGGGNITAAFTKALPNGKEVTLRTYNRAGTEIATLRQVYDEAGNLVRQGVIR